MKGKLYKRQLYDDNDQRESSLSPPHFRKRHKDEIGDKRNDCRYSLSPPPKKHHSDDEERRHRLEKKKVHHYSDDDRRNTSRNTTRDSRDPKKKDERKRNPFHRRREENNVKHEWGGVKIKQEPEEKPKPKEKPNLKTSGKLAEDTNTFRGVVIKYTEPEDARKPKRHWRLYRFKGETELPMIQLHRQSAFLFGRSRLVADIPTDHPSCSKQHAVLQFRLVPYERADGSKGRRVRPYIIDLGSANGTFLNNIQIEPSRYVELKEMDVIKFGYSSREYVILHEDVEKGDVNPLADEEFQVEEQDPIDNSKSK